MPLRLVLTIPLGLALIATGCAANPVRPECGGWRLAAANAGTFGMFGAFHCVGEATVDRCVAQGGDPAACRRAVFPPAPPRVNVIVSEPLLVR